MENKRAAMEMSIGTIVTIVLLMSVLILGIFLVQKVFRVGSGAIDEVDRAIQNEINKLFAEEGKGIVVYPPSRDITLKQGESGGFGFSIKNTEQTDGVFSYEVSFAEKDSNCQMSDSQAQSLIILGKEGENINLPSGVALENAILVKFRVPEAAPLCNLRYNIDVEKDGKTYGSTVSVDLEIK